MSTNEDEEAELRNPFPAPPSHYANYTTRNLELLRILKERAEGDPSQANQHEVLSDQTDVPDWPLTQLEKPRVDWILEDGYYTVFGDTWFVKETIPSLAESGGNQLYPTDPTVDRRPALLSIMKTMLVTYSHLLNALLMPPPTTSSGPGAQPEWVRHVEWITVMAQNLLAAANDLRPVQARGNLEMMMRRQLELRREETRNIHAKCDELEAKLSALSSSALDAADGAEQDTVTSPLADAMQDVEDASQQVLPLNAPVSVEEVLRWAEEVG
ncbi:Med7 domain-containing protein [Phanerochaete sordida]|uniref:Mediator of RNA polymerase II transcription subunit 7 n=1 Tax=Phanerochaete sordida TaxID=48140 RepID=A0A9P3G3S3_9APHY|nr:Med7 domain-containing protein [Phanerochaete sordida]